VANVLSRRFDLTDLALTKFILSSHPSQVGTSFKIYPLNPNVSSWVTSWLQQCKGMGSQKIQKMKRSEFGKGGPIRHQQLLLPMMFCSPISSQNNGLTLLVHLPLPSAGDNFLDQTKNAWLLQQSKRPWQNWVRCLGQMWCTTPHKGMDQHLCIYYLPSKSKECKI
jgi:hypothetical protein